MTGILQHSGDGGGLEHCGRCGALAAGPCARCRVPLCGDCCVITEHGAGKWAICERCAKGGTSLRAGWITVGIWLVVPLVVLAAVVGALSLLLL